MQTIGMEIKSERGREEDWMIAATRDKMMNFARGRGMNALDVSTWYTITYDDLKRAKVDYLLFIALFYSYIYIFIYLY